MSSTYQNFLAIIGLAILIFVGILGVGMENMRVNKDGEMNGCVFTSKVIFCKMSIVQHISLWQSMFAAAPVKNIIPTLLFFLIVFVIEFIILRKDLLNFLPLRYLQPNNIFFNPIKHSFARGILHPKIYEPAYI